MALVIACGCGIVFAKKDPNLTLLTQWPMLQAHDSATTYLPGGLLHPINNWAKTQGDGGVKGLLECGVRSFDWRPLWKNGKLTMHHDTIDVDYAMSDALDELISWVNTHGNNVEDVVLMLISHCVDDTYKQSAACEDAVSKMYASKNIKYITDCNQLASLTVAQAFSQAKQANGGAIIATQGCNADNWDDSVACAGFGNTEKGELSADNARKLMKKNDLDLSYTCFADSSTKQFPLDRMWAYVDRITNAADRPVSFYTVQTLWQETTNSVIVEELHAGTLLSEETWSQLNHLLATRIESGAWNVSRISQVEVNNACDGGPELVLALQKHS